MPSFPTPTNVVGVNANRRDPRKTGESPALQDPNAPFVEGKRGQIPEKFTGLRKTGKIFLAGA
jgi:hypothetical protein